MPLGDHRQQLLILHIFKMLKMVKTAKGMKYTTRSYKMPIPGVSDNVSLSNQDANRLIVLSRSILLKKGLPPRLLPFALRLPCQGSPCTSFAGKRQPIVHLHLPYAGGYVSLHGSRTCNYPVFTTTALTES